MSTTSSRPPRLPLAAERLRLPVWHRSMERMRERWGFDLDAQDILERSRSLVAESPDDAARVLLLAAALSRRGDLDLAEQQARRAVELTPDNARAHTTLAALLFAPATREEALLHARRAVLLDGDDPSVLYNLGIAEWVAGTHASAKEAFRRAEERLRAEAGGVDAPPGRRRGWWPVGRRG